MIYNSSYCDKGFYYLLFEKKYKDKTAEKEIIEDSLSNEFDMIYFFDIFPFTIVFLLEKGHTNEILENSIEKHL